ncbi:hypothetical protein [Azospirillum argentinense]|uniref:Uncharacterized protein n=1 Tax=Azospirillum argentinense TaxID=2970906 RepID=A0A5B0KNU0_9PROT|nr:hypothetical protein [Azospirillum argentinense]KAA1053220.1 hypothetical protein FH063_003139 [Azospirillum argentinense]
MAKGGKTVTTTVNKSAKDGKFVSNKDIQKKPSTTYKQTVTKKAK